MHNGLEEPTAHINIYMCTSKHIHICMDSKHIYIHTNTVTSQPKSFDLQVGSKWFYC